MKHLADAVITVFSFQKKLGGACIPDGIDFLDRGTNVYLGRVVQIIVVLERDVVVYLLLLPYERTTWLLVFQHESCRFI